MSHHHASLTVACMHLYHASFMHAPVGLRHVEAMYSKSILHRQTYADKRVREGERDEREKEKERERERERKRDERETRERREREKERGDVVLLMKQTHDALLSLSCFLCW